MIPANVITFEPYKWALPLAAYADNYRPASTEWIADGRIHMRAVNAAGAERIYTCNAATFDDIRHTQTKNTIQRIVDSLPRHPALRYRTRSLEGITTITIHHTAGAPFTSAASIAQQHIARGWPGIGYHYYILGDGTIQQVNDLATISYHAGSPRAPGDENAYSIGVALAGNFMLQPPPAAQLDALRQLLQHLRAALPASSLQILPHRAMPGASTDCCGDTWQQWLPDIIAQYTPAAACAFGVHASADARSLPDELAMYRLLQPGAIKILSSHQPDHVRQLDADTPGAIWIVRAFLDFGGRTITPEQFAQWTLPDVQRSIEQLQTAGQVLIELHNEPNLNAEGLASSWRDGAAFATWLQRVRTIYADQLPGAQMLWPGLSPGATVTNVRQNDAEFMQQAIDAGALEGLAGVALHAYWGGDGSAPADAADYVEQVRLRTPAHLPLYITECSHNGQINQVLRAAQYMEFWRLVSDVQNVAALTYFVASASNPVFSAETWTDKPLLISAVAQALKQ